MSASIFLTVLLTSPTPSLQTIVAEGKGPFCSLARLDKLDDCMILDVGLRTPNRGL